MAAKVDISMQLTTFFEGLRTGVSCMRELRKSYNKQMAFDFNSLNFFRLDENKTSEIIAFFLNPHAGHGQGDAFLKCFCSKLLPQNLFILSPEDYATATVRTEESTDENRRIDIVVRFPKKRILIGIENKIWAMDQEEQLDHYAEYLEKESVGNYHLFYLTPYGDHPSQVSILKDKYEKLVEEEKISLLSHDIDIISVMDDFVQVCMADNVQAFLKEFQKYLKQQYRGEKEMDEKAIVEQFIVKKENMALALDIAQQIHAVKNELWKETVKQLEDWASNNSCSLVVKAHSYDAMSNLGKSLLLNINKACDHKWSFELRFDGNRNGLYHRLFVTTESMKSNILEQAQSKLGYKYKSEVDIDDWFTPYNGSWDTDLRIWKAMIDKPDDGDLNTFATAVIDEYKRIEGIMDSILASN